MTRTSATLRRYIVVGLTGMLLAGLALSASAHESREVGGEFQFVVGFMNEPAYVDGINGLDLRITYLNSNNDEEADDDHGHEAGSDDHHGEDATPVENAHQTLEVTIQHGGESRELELRALFGQPGRYTADLIPTSTGAYTFQITGEIDGIEINESFQSGPDTFSEVEARDALEFPESGATPADDTDQAMAIGIAGVVAGLLGLLAGGVAYFKVTNTGQKMNPAQQRREKQQAKQQQEE